MGAAAGRQLARFLSVRDYLALSRSRTYSVLFALPLLLAYEALDGLVNRKGQVEVRNAADVLLRDLFALGGSRGGLGFLVVLTAGAALLLVREQRRRPVALRRQVFALMLAESAVLALVFGAVVSRLTAVLLAPLSLAAGLQAGLTRGQLLVLSLGAGIYEELLFRVLVVSAVVWLGARLAPGRSAAVAASAVTLSALLFAAFHYVGPMGDAWSLTSFTFRFLGGLAFSLIFVLRGFGIVAWTHALYDVFLLTLLAPIT